jgi:hypothetical protein
MMNSFANRFGPITVALAGMTAFSAATFAQQTQPSQQAQQQAQRAQQQTQQAQQQTQQAAQQARNSVLTEEVEEVQATVTKVDKAKRLVSLRTADGRETTLEAGAEIRNFDQIAVGDTVSAKFYEGLAAEVVAAPPGAQPAVIAGSRAPVGARPAGAVAAMVTAVVTIRSVDKEENTVAFTDADGLPREIAVVRPEMQQFIAGLKPGDKVQVTYGTGLAVEILEK